VLTGRTSLALTGATASSLALVVVEETWYVRVGLVALATVSCWSLVREPALPSAGVVGAIALVAGVAVTFGPRESHDVWSYADYGRMLAVHGVSPYLHTPDRFPHDALFHLVDWRTTPSIYGPAFNVFSAVGELVAGPSLLLARLWHQLFAAGLLAGALALVWRDTHDARSLVWLGLHPLMIVSVVNGGHNDLMVGFLVLVSVRSLARDHDVAGGMLATLAALVKLTAGLATAAAVTWSWTHRGRRGASRVLAGAALLVVLGTLPFGLQPFEVLRAHPDLVSRASVWRITILLQQAFGDNVPNLRAYGVLAVLALAGWVLARRRRDATPTVAVGGAVASFLAVGPYFLPWYAAWSLPTFASRREEPLARWVWWWAAIFLALYEAPAHFGGLVGDVNTAFIAVVVPLVALVTFVLCVRAPLRAAPSPQVAESSASITSSGAPDWSSP
jgi:alpha-1,6-mannosyltransferase